MEVPSWVGNHSVMKTQTNVVVQLKSERKLTWKRTSRTRVSEKVFHFVLRVLQKQDCEVQLIAENCGA